MALLKFFANRKSGSFDGAVHLLDLEGFVPQEAMDVVSRSSLVWKCEYEVELVPGEDGAPPEEVVAIKVLLRRRSLSILPVIFCPFLVWQSKYIAPAEATRMMFGILLTLFPQAARFVPGMSAPEPKPPRERAPDGSVEVKVFPAGKTLGGRTKMRDLYLSRIVRSWRSLRTPAALQSYLWRKWMELLGMPLMGPMLKGAPNGKNVLGTLTGQWSSKVTRPQVKWATKERFEDDDPGVWDGGD